MPLKKTIVRTGKKVLGKKGYRELVRAKHLANHYRLVRAAGFPAKGMKVIGVTGTNGKTTTCTYLYTILHQAGYKAALYSSTHFMIDGEYVHNDGEYGTTSENIRPILRFYQKCKEKGVTHVVQETTSQALHQWRLMGIEYDAGLITNLTYEHIDYHLTMKHYAKAKALLFKKPGLRLALLNRDDEWYDFFANVRSGAQKSSYGTSEAADYRISHVKKSIKGTDFRLDYVNGSLHIHLNQLGDYNVYNAAAAASMALRYGIDPTHITAALSSITTLDGRLQPIDRGQPFAVFADYAHTPDGIEQIGKTLREVTKGKTILVQSVFDGRDEHKWPMLGEAAAKHFDICIVTDEEASVRPTADMRNAIISGYKKMKFTRWHEIPNRGDAIKKALSLAKAGDSVTIIPQGNLTSRTFYGKTFTWDDREVAAAALEAMGYTQR